MPIPDELIIIDMQEQIRLITVNHIESKAFLPRNHIAERCGQFATVCRVSDTLPPMPRDAVCAKLGESPHPHDGRKWVEFQYKQPEKGE